MSTTRNCTRIAGRETIDGANVRMDFDSLMDLARQAEVRPNGAVNESRATGPSEQWDLSAGFDGMLRLVRGGWIEGRDRVRPMVEQMERLDMHDAPSRVPAFSQVGTRVHVPTFVSGSPRCYVRADQDVRDAPVVRIMLNVVASWQYDAADMLRRGAALACCVDKLEHAGRGVEVQIAAHAGRFGRSGGSFEVRAMVKQASEPLDLDTLVTAVAHGGVFRRLGFSLMEQYSGVEYDAFYRVGYGSPTNVFDVDATSIPMAQDKGQWQTPELALQSMMRLIPETQRLQEDA